MLVSKSLVQAILCMSSFIFKAVGTKQSEQASLQIHCYGPKDQSKIKITQLAHVATAWSASNFSSMAWNSVADKEMGIIAGGMDDGAVTLWDPNHILNSKSDWVGNGLLSVQNIHDGYCVNAIEFNP